MTQQRTLESATTEANLLATYAEKSTVQAHLIQALTESEIRNFAVNWTTDPAQDYLYRIHKRETKGIYTEHATGVIIFQYPTVFKNGNGAWFTIRTGKMIDVDYNEQLATAKDIVANCSKTSELIEKLIAAEFPYFNLNWDESQEAQDAATEMEDILSDINMFQNKNGNWITLSIDPNAHF